MGDLHHPYYHVVLIVRGWGGRGAVGDTELPLCMIVVSDAIHSGLTGEEIYTALCIIISSDAIHSGLTEGRNIDTTVHDYFQRHAIHSGLTEGGNTHRHKHTYTRTHARYGLESSSSRI